MCMQYDAVWCRLLSWSGTNRLVCVRLGFVVLL